MARKKVSFDGAPPPPLPPEGPVHEYEHVDKRGRPWTWRFTTVGIATVARELAVHLGPTLQEAFAGKSAPRVRDHDYAWRALGRRMRSVNGDGDFGLGSLTDADIDACDRRGCKTQIFCLVSDLRTIDAAAPDLFSEAVKIRLRKVSRYRASDGKRREPLPDVFADRLLAKADEAVALAKDRIDAGRRLLGRLNALESPKPYDIARLKLLEGVRPTKAVKAIVRAQGERTLEYSRAAILAMDDAVAFAISLGLRLEMPIECLKDLQRDCIVRSNGKSAWIRYTKGRGGTSERIKFERIRDGGISTPGGLIRLLLRLTQPAADRLDELGHADANSLWLGYLEKGSPTWRQLTLCNAAFRRTVASWKIEDDRGKLVVTFSPARMRKTTKAASYRRKRGNIPRFATDHTKKTATRHYAAVEDLEEEHTSSIEAAEHKLLESALKPTVLTPEDETAAAIEGVTINGRYIDPDTFAALVGGGSDTFFGICLDFWRSPFGAEKDGGCPVPFTPCLHCPNAVFTRAKLVALITLLIWIEERRSILGLGEWIEAYGLDRARIRCQILPQFAQTDVDAAWTIARASGEMPVIPPHWRNA